MTPQESRPAPVARTHGFLVAVLLIGATMSLVGVPVLREDIQGAKELAAVFSGWIAAIVGFYFLQGQTQQVATVVGEKEREKAETAMSGCWLRWKPSAPRTICSGESWQKS